MSNDLSPPVLPTIISAPLCALLLLGLPLDGTTGSSDPTSVWSLVRRSRGLPMPQGPAHSDIVYKRSGLGRLRLDVYEPPGRTESAVGSTTAPEGMGGARDRSPVIVFFHGGSWVRGDKITIRIVGRPLRRMRSKGYSVVAVNYTTSLLRGIEESVQNAVDAVEWVGEHSDEYGFDPTRIGLYGVSAGGHVALMAASGVGFPR